MPRIKFITTGHSHLVGNFSAGDTFTGDEAACRHFVEDAHAAVWNEAGVEAATVQTPGPSPTPAAPRPPRAPRTSRAAPTAAPPASAPVGDAPDASPGPAGEAHPSGAAGGTTESGAPTGN